MVREGLEGGASPLFSRKFPFAHREGLERGLARIELRGIPGAPCINPARRGGGREASRGWKGMRPGVPRRGPDLGSDPPPHDPYGRL